MPRPLRRAIRIAALLAAVAAPASADGIFLVAAYPARTSLPVVGASVGQWSRAVGFEIEVAATVGASAGDRIDESLTANLLVRTPLRIRGAQLYGVAGIGVYGQIRGSVGSGEVQAVVLGAGVNIPLRHRLRLRCDYRVLSGATDGSAGFPKTVHAQRIALGIGVGF